MHKANYIDQCMIINRVNNQNTQMELVVRSVKFFGGNDLVLCCCRLTNFLRKEVVSLIG